MNREPGQLTEDQAKILLQADLKNLAKKIQSGKTLSSAERKILESSLKTKDIRPQNAKNKSKLAEALGISRATLYRYSQQDGAPKAKPNGSHVVAEWEEFIDRQQSGGGSPFSMKEAKVQQILLQNQKLEIEIGILSGEYVRTAEAARYVSTIITESKNRFLQIPASHAPLVVGESISEAEKKLREAILEAMEDLHTNPEWNREQ